MPAKRNLASASPLRQVQLVHTLNHYDQNLISWSETQCESVSRICAPRAESCRRRPAQRFLSRIYGCTQRFADAAAHREAGQPTSFLILLRHNACRGSR